jgi:hypothetical protein
VGFTELRGKQVSIRAGGAAADTPLMLAVGQPDGCMPRPIISHWTLDGKHATIEVGDDEEEGGLSSHIYSRTQARAYEQLIKSALSTEPPSSHCQLTTHLSMRWSRD